MGTDRIRTKIKPGHWAFGNNFLFQFEPVIRKPDDKELEYFQLFLSGGVDNTRWKKSSAIRSDVYFPEWKPAFNHGKWGGCFYK